MMWRTILGNKDTNTAKVPPIPSTNDKITGRGCEKASVEGIGGRICNLKNYKNRKPSQVKIPIDDNIEPGALGEKNQASGTRQVVEKHGRTRKEPRNRAIVPGWILDNSEALRLAGFTDGDIVGTRRAIGIADLDLWSKPGISAKLIGDTIFFTWKNPTGRKIIQTCRPENALQ